MAYATLADLMEFTGQETTAPGDERQLQRASDLVDAALQSAYYTVDASGNATDAGVIAALRNATCAQVEWWRQTGDEMGAKALTRPAPGARATSPAPTMQGAALRRLCPRALEYLTVPNLWRHKPLAW